MALVGVLAVGLVLVFASTASAATLTLSPTSGTAGTSVQARGTGFGKKLRGSIDFGVTSVAMFRTNPKGTFSTSFSVPDGYSGSVSVTARTAAAAASTSFNVTGAPPPPPPGGDPVIAGAGDIAGDANDGEPTAKLLDSIAPTTVYTLGDNAYESGTIDQYRQFYDPTWGRHKAKTRPAPGNHEYQTPNGAGYFEYFNPLQSYYSYDLGNWHLISLNGEISHSPGSAQELFLQSDLATNTAAKCILAYWHEPRFTSGSVHGDNTSFDAFWQDLYAAKADVVLNGHNHNYERFALQNPQAQADSNGIREFVAGTGGRSHYGFTTPKPNSQVRNGDTFGVLKLTLHPGSYDWQFVPIAGQTFTDSGTTSCHSSSP